MGNHARFESVLSMDIYSRLIVIAAVIVLFIIAADSLYDAGKIKKVITSAVLTVLVCLMVYHSGAKQDLATVPKLSQATNGLYEVLATFKNVDGTTLAMIHPANITHIDVTERKLVSLKLGSPQLLAIDHPIASLQPTNSGTFKEFVEITGEGEGKVIQTFRPFPTTQ